MNDQDRWWLRIGLLHEFVARSSSRLGRTAIMKLAYLLQAVKGLPLGYHFRLHTYGPFDSDVLHDLATAESMGIVKSEMVIYPSGYGYEFSPGSQWDMVKSKIEDRIGAYRSEISWALEGFGKESAAHLELISTIVYADREVAASRRQLRTEELGRKVKEIKPHFPDDFITKKIQELARQGLLEAAS